MSFLIEKGEQPERAMSEFLAISCFFAPPSAFVAYYSNHLINFTDSKFLKGVILVGITLLALLIGYILLDRYERFFQYPITVLCGQFFAFLCAVVLNSLQQYTTDYLMKITIFFVLDIAIILLLYFSYIPQSKKILFSIITILLIATLIFSIFLINDNKKFLNIHPFDFSVTEPGSYANVLNTGASIYHEPTCVMVDVISEEHKVYVYEFGTAVDSGYAACEICCDS